MIDILPNWHPIFVHFTVALLFVAAILFWIGWAVRESALGGTLLTVARWTLWIGAGFTVATVAAGVYAFETVSHSEAGHPQMVDHRNWAIPTAVVWWAIAVWAGWDRRKGRALGLPFLLSLVVAGGLLAVTAYKGGELVYRYGVGVEAAQSGGGASGGAGHAHDAPAVEGSSMPMDADNGLHMNDNDHMDEDGHMEDVPHGEPGHAR